LKPFKILVICGPTAVGKTDLSLKLAQKYSGEIISADSRQFFKELNIGTAKPSREELSQVPHHFINSHSIAENYTAGKFEEDGIQTIDDIASRDKLPFIVGGSGLYISALLNGIDQPPSDPELRSSINKELEEKGLEHLQERLKLIDPEKFNSIDLNNSRRVVRAVEIAELKKQGKSFNKQSIKRNFEPVIVVLNRERPDLYNRINRRVDAMIERGLLDEVKMLLPYKDRQAMQTVGYRELVSHYEGKLNLDDAVNLIKQNTRRYAKRQITWFKRLENAMWFNPDDQNGITTHIEKSLNGPS